jgi:hypothetical protein
VERVEAVRNGLTSSCEDLDRLAIIVSTDMQSSDPLVSRELFKCLHRRCSHVTPARYGDRVSQSMRRTMDAARTSMRAAGVRDTAPFELGDAED